MQKYTDQNKATSEAAHVSNHLQIPVQVSDINTVVLMLRHRRFIFLNLFFLNSSNLVLPALINNLADSPLLLVALTWKFWLLQQCIFVNWLRLCLMFALLYLVRNKYSHGVLDTYNCWFLSGCCDIYSKHLIFRGCSVNTLSLVVHITVCLLSCLLRHAEWLTKKCI